MGEKMRDAEDDGLFDSGDEDNKKISFRLGFSAALGTFLPPSLMTSKQTPNLVLRPARFDGSCAQFILSQGGIITTLLDCGLDYGIGLGRTRFFGSPLNFQDLPFSSALAILRLPQVVPARSTETDLLQHASSSLKEVQSRGLRVAV